MTDPSPPTSVQPLPPVELRVLHGPQAGSRMPLAYDESYEMGTSDDCSIIILGGQVEARHARLRVLASGMVIESVQGAVVASGLGDAADAVLTFGSVVSLGRVRLTVDLADAPWPQDEQIENAAAVLAVEAVDDAHPVGSGPSEPAVEGNGATGSRGLARMNRPVLAAACIALVCAWALAFMLWQDEQLVVQAQAAKPAIPQPSEQELLQTRLKLLEERFGQSLSVSIARHSDGAWLVSGRAANAQMVSAIRESLGSPNVRLEFVLDAQRLSHVQQAAARADPARLRLRAELSVDSTITLRGAASDQQSVDEFVGMLRQSVAQVEPLAVKVDLPTQLRLAFRDALRETQFGHKLKVLREEPELYLEGVLTASERVRWERLFAEFTQQHGNLLPIRALVREERDQIAGRIRTVVEGSYPYLMTTTGERVAPGGQLDGRTVLSVRAGEVAFADGMRVQVGR